MRILLIAFIFNQEKTLGGGWGVGNWLKGPFAWIETCHTWHYSPNVYDTISQFHTDELGIHRMLPYTYFTIISPRDNTNMLPLICRVKAKRHF